MNTIKENITNELIIKGSKFIGYLFVINANEEVDLILQSVKKEHKDATHICYAYRLKNTEKASDDGEPSGTAGMPILDVLRKNDLINILAITVRYFGGTKLGIGGLIRSYRNSIKYGLKKTSIVPYHETIDITLVGNYSEEKVLNNLCKNYNIINKIFNDRINYTIRINKEDYNSLKERITNTNIKIK